MPCLQKIHWKKVILSTQAHLLQRWGSCKAKLVCKEILSLMQSHTSEMILGKLQGEVADVIHNDDLIKLVGY